MRVPRRSPRRKTLLFVAAFALIAFLVVGTFAESQAPKKLTARNDEKLPQNAKGIGKAGMGEKYQGNPATDCWAHHSEMRDALVVYPVMPQQFQVGKPYDLPVQIINPWNHEVQAPLSLEVSLPGAEQVLSVQGKAANAAAARDIRGSKAFCLGPTQFVQESLPEPARSSAYCPYNVGLLLDIPLGATYLVVHAEFSPGAGAGANPNGREGYGFGFRTPLAKNWQAKDPADNATYTNLTRDLVIPINGGQAIIEMTHFQGEAVRTEVYLNYTIIMAAPTAGARSYTIDIPFEKVAKRGADTVLVPITPFRLGAQDMRFKVRSKIFYEHQGAGTPNDDYYTRLAVLDEEQDLIRGNTITPQRRAQVGASFIASPYGVSEAVVAGEDWRMVMGEISGFAAAGLLLPSLLLGGAYGKGSRRLLNDLLGGAKRRVMYHNIMSLGLTLVALFHLVLFLLEVRYTLLMGILWGGLSVLSLLILGLTGYYQVPLIQRHGYNWWRNLHLVVGLLVVVFVSYHAIADGPDFFFIKELIPKWINDVNLSQK